MAIAGVVLGGAAWCARMYRLSRYYPGRSASYEFRHYANPKDPWARVSDRENQMMKEYDRLAMFPWGAVEPDPPEPK